MRRANLSMVLTAVVLVFLSGCSSRVNVNFAVEGDRMTDVKRGQILNLEFDSNPTTGYLWELARETDNKALERIGKYRYIRSSREVIGAGGKQVFRFKAVRKGTETMVFMYRRPWEEGEPPVKEYEVRVIVH